MRNVTRGETFRAEPLPDFIMEIVRSGGLVPWVRARRGAGAA